MQSESIVGYRASERPESVDKDCCSIGQIGSSTRLSSDVLNDLGSDSDSVGNGLYVVINTGTIASIFATKEGKEQEWCRDS